MTSSAEDVQKNLKMLKQSSTQAEALEFFQNGNIPLKLYKDYKVLETISVLSNTPSKHKVNAIRARVRKLEDRLLVQQDKQANSLKMKSGDDLTVSAASSSTSSSSTTSATATHHPAGPGSISTNVSRKSIEIKSATRSLKNEEKSSFSSTNKSETPRKDSHNRAPTSVMSNEQANRRTSSSSEMFTQKTQEQKTTTTSSEEERIRATFMYSYAPQPSSYSIYRERLEAKEKAKRQEAQRQKNRADPKAPVEPSSAEVAAKRSRPPGYPENRDQVVKREENWKTPYGYRALYQDDSLVCTMLYTPERSDEKSESSSKKANEKRSSIDQTKAPTRPVGHDAMFFGKTTLPISKNASEKRSFIDQTKAPSHPVSHEAVIKEEILEPSSMKATEKRSFIDPTNAPSHTVGHDAVIKKEMSEPSSKKATERRFSIDQPRAPTHPLGHDAVISGKTTVPISKNDTEKRYSVDQSKASSHPFGYDAVIFSENPESLWKKALEKIFSINQTKASTHPVGHDAVFSEKTTVPISKNNTEKRSSIDQSKAPSHSVGHDAVIKEEESESSSKKTPEKRCSIDQSKAPSHPVGHDAVIKQEISEPSSKKAPEKRSSINQTKEPAHPVSQGAVISSKESSGDAPKQPAVEDAPIFPARPDKYKRTKVSKGELRVWHRILEGGHGRCSTEGLLEVVTDLNTIKVAPPFDIHAFRRMHVAECIANFLVPDCPCLDFAFKVAERVIVLEKACDPNSEASKKLEDFMAKYKTLCDAKNWSARIEKLFRTVKDEEVHDIYFTDFILPLETEFHNISVLNLSPSVVIVIQNMWNVRKNQNKSDIISLRKRAVDLKSMMSDFQKTRISTANFKESMESLETEIKRTNQKILNMEKTVNETTPAFLIPSKKIKVEECEKEEGELSDDED